MILPTGRSTALHESYHAAGLILGGVVPLEVRVDYPDRKLAGVVRLDDWDIENRETVRTVLAAIMLGPLADGESLEWPVDPNTTGARYRSDAAAAAALVKLRKLDVVDWHHAVWKANDLARRREFRRLVVALAAALEETEVLTAEDLRRIQSEAARGEQT